MPRTITTTATLDVHHVTLTPRADHVEAVTMELDESGNEAGPRKVRIGTLTDAAAAFGISITALRAGLHRLCGVAPQEATALAAEDVAAEQAKAAARAAAEPQE